MTIPKPVRALYAASAAGVVKLRNACLGEIQTAPTANQTMLRIRDPPAERFGQSGQIDCLVAPAGVGVGWLVAVGLIGFPKALHDRC